MNPTLDLGRLLWCRSQAAWRVGYSLGTLEADFYGAIEAGQSDVVGHVARAIAEECATVLHLAVGHARPLPDRAHRVSEALPHLEADVRTAIEWLTRLPIADDAMVERIRATVEDVTLAVREAVGDVPTVIDPTEYFQALRMGGDWLEALQSVGEADFLPSHWKAAAGGGDA